MKLLNIIKILLRNFRKKMRIGIRNPHTGEELWYIFISPLNVCVAFLTLILITFVAVIMTIIYTPILDMIPGYPGNKSRELLIKNLIRLDSIEQQIQTWETYRHNIGLIMEGKTPISVTASKNADSIGSGQRENLPASAADSAFRQQMRNDLALAASAQRNNVRTFELYSPVTGVVARRFDLSKNFRGIEVSVAGREPVAAVTDGAVLLNLWTPEEGYVMQIQHGGNMISTYKHLSGTMRNTGDRVKAGEIIGYVGNEENESGDFASLYFELWNNGSAVDPEEFILF